MKRIVIESMDHELVDEILHASKMAARNIRRLCYSLKDREEILAVLDLVAKNEEALHEIVCAGSGIEKIEIRREVTKSGKKCTAFLKTEDRIEDELLIEEFWRDCQ